MSEQPLALVTGAAHRLGKAFVFALARKGYAILLHYRHSDVQADRTATEIRTLGVPVFVSQADLTDPKQISSLFAAVDKIKHPLKVLVNSAAIMPAGEARTLSVKDWDAALDLNLRAPFLCAQAAAKRMTDGGLIVNVTDVGAQKAWSRYPSYTVSKAGLEALTKILARAFAPTIRVNAIAPGLVLQSDVISPEEWARLINRLPLKRTAKIEEIASALDFLLDNQYITGQTVVVDGGYSLLG
ncbi:MAG: SDR family oxidoreductase [Chloroflexi bacterium]|nr:SDR family oxidoreductase [Chloroflexota bacterium]MBI3339357.1 SDR family oxidoreductase [Chloroflexota bacterium]